MDCNQWIKIEQGNGATLGIGKASPIQLLEVDGLFFKDLNQNGVLDIYEDWRCPVEERVNDLVQQLSVEEMAGLMLYSSHQSVSSQQSAFAKMFAGSYNGQPFEHYNGQLSDLTDQQKEALITEKIRHFLVTVVDSPEISAAWTNNLQLLAEQLPYGIPVNISSDPRHSTSADTEFNAGAGGSISKWPEQLGLAATFQPEIVKEFGTIARQEYRALGIATALSPQIDLATEPRWMRFDGTFGEGTSLVTELAQAYCDGFQTTPDTAGWGSGSVNTMVKHWPGGGSGEAGRDAHFGYGKYAVYPGENFEEHLKPFVDGAFQLADGTKKAAAVMPYYTISYNVDQVNHENVGNGYSRYLVTDLLREKYKYDGVVCTDWGITKDAPAIDDFFSGKPWGVEALSVEERHYKAMLAGVDQFGGNNLLAPVLAAFQLGVEEFGYEKMLQRFQQSAKRLLTNIMQVGLFENPYSEVDKAKELVGNPTFMAKGYHAQLNSVVLLKNQELLPLVKQTKVYIPASHLEERKDWFGQTIPATSMCPVNTDIVNKFFTITAEPEEAEVFLCFIQSPISSAYDHRQGFLPISLQYGRYHAQTARKKALADETRSYYQKETIAANHQDAEQLKLLREQYPDKKIVVVLTMKNPTIMTELETYADAILTEFGVQTQAILDVLTGEFSPAAKLPFQLPASMDTVETQQEDVPLDMEVYQDQQGNRYDFGFGLSYEK